jgi:hypothetical protein
MDPFLQDSILEARGENVVIVSDIIKGYIFWKAD